MLVVCVTGVWERDCLLSICQLMAEYLANARLKCVCDMYDVEKGDCSANQ